MGDAQRYLEANLDWLRANAPGRGAWVGPGAVVGEAVTLSQTVVGADARVDGNGLVERCVLWPGARATAPLRDAIVTAGGRVVEIDVSGRP